MTNTQDDEKIGNIAPIDVFESNDLDAVEATAKDVDKLMENIYQLETGLDSEKEERLEERFYWICVIAILFDVVAIQAIAGSWLFVLIFMLQTIVLLGLAKRLGVDWAVKLLGWLLHWISEHAKLNK